MNQVWIAVVLLIPCYGTKDTFFIRFFLSDKFCLTRQEFENMNPIVERACLAWARESACFMIFSCFINWRFSEVKHYFFTIRVKNFEVSNTKSTCLNGQGPTTTSGIVDHSRGKVRGYNIYFGIVHEEGRPK